MRSQLLRDIRPLDVVVTAMLCALTSWLMVEDIVSRDAAVRIDSHSWWLLPVFLAAAVPVLWWRRGVVEVLLVSCVAMAVHVLAFGSLVRCGSGLPLTFVLAFLVGLERTPRRRVLALLLVALLASLVLVRDTAAGVGLLPVVLLVSLLLAGVGRVVAHRLELSRDLQRRNEDLRRLRDDRAALEVGSQRLELSARLEALLDQRLAQLAAAAEQGTADADPAATKALLVTLEDEGRRTLGDMREIVGLLRGGEVALAPVPSVAHLDALLARHLRSGQHLEVSGDPRMLPASVELSAYRIVEHLVSALSGDASVPVGVAITFTDDALEIRVAGPAARSGELRAAVGRARERARLHAGSLEVKVARGQARMTALLPVPSGS